MICKLRRFLYIIILVFFGKIYSVAQVSDSASVKDSAIVDSSVTTAVADSSVIAEEDNSSDTMVTQSSFSNDEDSILKWSKGREFGYMAYLDSILKKRKDLRQDTMNVDEGSLTKNKSSSSSTSYTSGSSGIFLNSRPVKIFFWALAAFFIVFIIYRLFFKSNLFAREKVIQEEAGQEEPEKLNEFSAYYSLINDAEKNNDYTHAIRYLYLQSLRRLAEKEVIVFMPDKTNNDYVRELTGRAFQQEFVSLTQHYEYVWYGRFAISMNTYNSIKEKFMAFNKTV